MSVTALSVLADNRDRSVPQMALEWWCSRFSDARVGASLYMSCLNEDSFATLLSGRCGEAERQEILRHCSDCETCYLLLVDSLRLGASTGEGARLSAAECNLGTDLLLRGMVVGRYEIVDLIGIGGMGVVYSARDPQLNRRVALKLVRTDRGWGAERAAELLQREAQTMARLCHPHVLTVYEASSFRGCLYIAMALVEGQTAARWQRERPRSVLEILQVYLAVGKGLAAAHRAGVLHRDVKPENILISRQGDVYISDFGLSHTVGVREDSLLTEESALSPRSGRSVSSRSVGFAGTAGYVAPEIHAGQRARAASDQYSFCVALYEAVQGHLPFESDQRKGLTPGKRSDHHRLPPFRSGVPRWLRKVLTRGLHADPDQRFPSMDELLRHCQSAIHRRERAQAGLAASVLLLLLAGLAVGHQISQHSHLRCEGTAESLSGGWTVAMQSELRNRLLSNSQPHIANAARDLVNALSNYNLSAMRSYSQVCESMRKRDNVAVEQLEPKRDCIILRLSTFRELVSLLSSADTPLSEQTLQAVRDLPSVDDCNQDGQTTARWSGLPQDHTVRERQQEAHGLLAKAYANMAAGQYGMASQLSLRSIEEANGAGARQTLLEAQWLYGLVCDRQQEFVAAERSFQTVFLSALEQRQDRLAVMAATALARALGRGQHRLDEGTRYADIGQALLQRIGNPVLLGAELDLVRGSLLRLGGKPSAALVLDERALGALTSYYGEDNVELFKAMGQLAVDHRAVARFAEAEFWFLRAHTLLQRAFGDLHPETIRLLVELGVTASRQHRYTEALQRCQTAERNYGMTQRPADFLEAQLLSCRAEAEVNLGRCRDAETDLRKLLVLDEKRVGHRSNEVVVDLVSLGSTLVECRTSPAEAVRLLEDGLHVASALKFSRQRIAHIELELAYAMDLTGERSTRPRQLAESAFRTLNHDASTGGVDQELVDKAAHFLRQHGGLNETELSQPKAQYR